MKHLNLIITIGFIVIFAVIFFNIENLLTTPAEPLLDYKSKPLNKDFFMIQEVKENAYIKGGIGAVIGWAVKNICDFILGVVKTQLGRFKKC